MTSTFVFLRCVQLWELVLANHEFQKHRTEVDALGGAMIAIPLAALVIRTINKSPQSEAEGCASAEKSGALTGFSCSAW